MLDPTVHLTLRLILAVILAVAALHKWVDPRRFRALLENYQLLPTALITPAAGVVMVGETAIAIGVVIGRPIAILAALALLALYTAAIGLNLLRGRRDIDCGCSGPALKQTLSGWLVVRNVLLIGLTGALLLPTGTRGLHWLDWFTVGLAAGAMLLLYQTANQLLATYQRFVIN